MWCHSWEIGTFSLNTPFMLYCGCAPWLEVSPMDYSRQYVWCVQPCTENFATGQLRLTQNIKYERKFSLLYHQGCWGIFSLFNCSFLVRFGLQQLKRLIRYFDLYFVWALMLPKYAIFSPVIYLGFGPACFSNWHLENYNVKLVWIICCFWSFVHKARERLFVEIIAACI